MLSHKNSIYFSDSKLIKKIKKFGIFRTFLQWLLSMQVIKKQQLTLNSKFQKLVYCLKTIKTKNSSGNI
jgi:hypothetical protein